MRRDWLQTSTGINVVAVGLYAIMFSLVVFTLEDLWILSTGKLWSVGGPSGIWALLWAAVATVFSGMSVLIWRPGIPRIILGMFSISMASHILEQIIVVPAQQLKMAAVCRLFVAGALVLLVLRDRSTTTIDKP